ncbi:MAG: hypothetical protein HYV26_11385, partial [Candidatus Hydrogenedentes bacterium]|nr:hypothetical protein [Candidatus Hydrogenedentota bacterium]
RISLGVQSFHEATLRYLGRRHDAAGALRACETIASRFDNWNLDLIFGAPPIEHWPDTLARTVALRPPHVATYGLTYETGTPFERRRDQAVDDETWLRLYQQAEEALGDYDHYEISNLARPGFQSRHNLIYWHNEEYAGFGTGAYSFLGGVRARNHATIDAYLAAPGEKEECLGLTEREIMLETIIQHLRLRDGLDKHYYTARFGTAPEVDFALPLRLLAGRGLIEDTATVIRPTREGFTLNNEIGTALLD